MTVTRGGFVVAVVAFGGAGGGISAAFTMVRA